MKSYKIGIIGLGYVGFPLACLFAKKYPTIGYDPQEKRIAQLREGIDITNEIDTEVIQARLNTYLQCTNDPNALKCIYRSSPHTHRPLSATRPYSTAQSKQNRRHTAQAR